MTLVEATRDSRQLSHNIVLEALFKLLSALVDEVLY
jgi:hypothetical protein